MAITATDVKKLRDATGAGMMDAKKALTEADGDFDKATEILRVSGSAKAAKRGERTAAEGMIASAGNVLVEVNCETDFVAKTDKFRELGAAIAAAAEKSGAADADSLLAADFGDGRTVEQALIESGAVIGEKLAIGKLVRFDGTTATYLHRRSADLPPAVGVLVEFTGPDADVARAAAMQIAAMRPEDVTRDEVPADVVAKERDIAEQTARAEGKPEQAIGRIVDGRLNGFFKDAVLTEQPSVTQGDKTVGQLLQAAGVTLTRFARLEVGQA
jgi:elongation factor Ts